LKKKKSDPANSCHYNLRLSERDRNFVRELYKYGDDRSAKSNEKYLTQAFSNHLRAVFVMQTALMFKAAGWISPLKCDAVFKDLDQSFDNFEKLVDRLDREFKNLYRKKLGKKK
jgi:hypothetical protein